MKEENKYYTPEISEFHVGFEYEYYNEYHRPDGIWEKVGLNEFDDWFVHNFEIEKSRVKYLDKQDIEDLGFKEDENNSTPDRLNLELYKNGFTIGVVLYNVTELIIYKYTGKEDVLFRGTIKNKSELKKLLKQIGI